MRATNLPPGLTIDGTTGIIRGTPTATGDYQVEITATDTDGNSTTSTFRWNINNIDPSAHGAG